MRTKKNLYHTQAVYCCLFTGLHLGPLYHSIRTAFTPHSREKGPSIKLKTSRCHWRAHRKRPKVLSLLSFLLSLSLSLLLLLLFWTLWWREREGEWKRKKASNRGHLLTPELLSLSRSFSFLSICSLLFSSSLSLSLWEEISIYSFAMLPQEWAVVSLRIHGGMRARDHIFVKIVRKASMRVLMRSVCWRKPHISAANFMKIHSNL